jgi:hypothetical protein
LRSQLHQLLDYDVSKARLEAKQVLEGIFAKRWHRVILSRNFIDMTTIVGNRRESHSDINLAKSAEDFKAVFEKISEKA